MVKRLKPSKAVEVFDLGLPRCLFQSSANRQSSCDGISDKSGEDSSLLYHWIPELFHPNFFHNIMIIWQWEQLCLNPSVWLSNHLEAHEFCLIKTTPNTPPSAHQSLSPPQNPFRRSQVSQQALQAGAGNIRMAPGIPPGWNLPFPRVWPPQKQAMKVALLTDTGILIFKTMSSMLS